MRCADMFGNREETVNFAEKRHQFLDFEIALCYCVPKQEGISG